MARVVLNESVQQITGTEERLETRATELVIDDDTGLVIPAVYIARKEQTFVEYQVRVEVTYTTLAATQVQPMTTQIFTISAGPEDAARGFRYAGNSKTISTEHMMGMVAFNFVVFAVV